MRRILCLIAVLALSAPSHGQFDAKQTAKDFRADVQQLEKTQKLAHKAALSTLKGALAAVAKTFHSGAGDSNDVSLAIMAVIAFQDALFAESIGGTAYAPLALQLLAHGFVDDPDTPEFHPEGMTSGDGGTIDRFVSATRARHARLDKQLRKRLAKLAKLVEQRAGLLMSVRVFPVGGPEEVAANVGLAEFVPSIPTHLDTLIALSDPSNGLINRVVASGTAFPNAGGVIVSLSGADVATVSVPIDPETGRFTAIFSVAPPGLPRGNYLVRARRSGELTSDVAAIGLR